MSAMRITIGVGLDRNARDVLTPVIEATKRARRVIQSELEGAASVRLRTEKKVSEDVVRVKAAAGKDEVRAEQKTAKALEKIREELNKKVDTSGAAAAKSMVTAAEIRLKGIQGLTDKASQATANMAEGLSRIDRMTARVQARAHNIREFTSGLSRNVRGAAAFGRETASNLAAGYGIDFSLSGMIQGSVQRQSLAQKIANNANNSINGANFTGGGVQDMAKTISTKTATSQADVLQGIEAFGGLTGQLDILNQITASGRTAGEELAILAKATGSSFEDMSKATGELVNKLGDIPNAGQVAIETMRSLGGGGQVGSIEIEHYAKQMAKLAAQSGQFKLNAGTAGLLSSKGVSNETGQNIAVMGALGQGARQLGSRSSPATAANSAFAFIRDFGTQTSIKRLNEKMGGYSAFADDSKTTLKDPKQIITDILRYTKGDQGKLAYLMPNQNSRDVVKGYGNVYTKAKAGGASEEQALEAVSKAYDKYLTVTMTGEEVMKKFNATMGTAESKAVLLQENLNKSADSMANRLLPTMERLAPKVEKAVEAFTSFIAWAAENPGKLVGAALTTSIANAALGATFKAAIEKALTGGGPGGAGMGAVGAAGLIASLSIAAVTVGVMTVDNFFDKKNAAEKKAFEDDMNDTNKASAMNAKLGRGEKLTDEEMKEFGAIRDRAGKRASDARGKAIGGADWQEYGIAAIASTPVGMIANKLAGNGFLGGITAFNKEGQNREQAAKDAEVDADRMARAFKKALIGPDGTLNVTVKNQPTPELTAGRTKQ